VVVSSIFDLIVLGTCGWMGFNLWQGTTCHFARAITLASIAYLAWSLAGP
jgi:hypothetical protein